MGDIIASMQHVNVRVETDYGPYTVDLRPDLVSENGGRVATMLTDKRAAAHFYSDVGFVHLVQGRTAEARQAMVTATQVDPQCAIVWSNRATLHLRLGELAAARSCYERSLQIDRRGLNVLVGLVADRDAFLAAVANELTRSPILPHALGRVVPIDATVALGGEDPVAAVVDAVLPLVIRQITESPFLR